MDHSPLLLQLVVILATARLLALCAGRKSAHGREVVG